MQQSDPFQSNATVALLQTIAMQNMQLQQALFQSNLSQLRTGFGPDMSLAANPVGGLDWSKKDGPKFEPRDRQRLGQSVSRANNASDPGVQKRKSRSQMVKKRWRVAICTILFIAAASKKYRLMRLFKKPRSFMEQSVDELEEKLVPYVQAFKEQLKELSYVESIDFLLKDTGNLFSFAKRPSKSQSQRFAAVVNGVVELCTKVTFHGSPKSKELLRKFYYGDVLVKSYLWDVERAPPSDFPSKATILVYFVLVKCILARIFLKSSSEMSETEERNTRALCLIVYRIARQVGQDTCLEMDSQFKRVVQAFCGSSEEANYWNDTTCKLLFKTFASEIKTNTAKLLDWVTTEINADMASDDALASQTAPVALEEQADGAETEADKPTPASGAATSKQERKGSMAPDSSSVQRKSSVLSQPNPPPEPESMEAISQKVVQRVSEGRRLSGANSLENAQPNEQPPRSSKSDLPLPQPAPNQRNSKQSPL
ncbi:hypothetical protein HDV03_001726 [Kappamyces sp. JEL0829]|nr:hypothetical protein HDV03_001726 [Kappamyces sp. JEL0829]